MSRLAASEILIAHAVINALFTKKLQNMTADTQ